jgi:ankyrin repeat protein
MSSSNVSVIPHAPTERELHSFFTAAYNGDMETLRHFIGAGMNVDSLPDCSNAVFSEFEGNPAIALAARSCHLDAVKLLLDGGADINRNGSPFSMGSALMQACECGDLELVVLLQRRGAADDSWIGEELSHAIGHCAASIRHARRTEYMDCMHW